MTDYEYDEYQEVMNQALQNMNELLDSFCEHIREIMNERTASVAQNVR